MSNTKTSSTKIEFKTLDHFNRLFTFIPETLDEFKKYSLDNSHKGLRYKYLNYIWNRGITQYYKTITDQTPDFWEGSDKVYLVDFETQLELNEWIISGLSKKSQDEIFTHDSGPDSP